MASTFAVTRNHLILGLCLPLAVLLGYMLADIDDPASRVVIVVALALLAVPALMRWYHPLLILSWNSAAQPALPGNPLLWSLMAVLGLFFAVLNRSVNPEHRFAQVPSLTRPMVVLMIVVVGTALLTGGIGVRELGSSAVGGKNYFYLLAAVAGFFALSSRPIPVNRAGFYVALFFLPGVTSVISRVANAIGPKADFVYAIFPPDFLVDELALVQPLDTDLIRVGGLTLASLSVFSWLLARYGVAGLFDFSRPWRMAGFALAVIAGAFGGYRSVLLLMFMAFAILFWFEKLWRTRIVVILLGASLIGGTLLAGFAHRLPLPVQRTLSFLPLNIDPVTRESADISTKWRLDMWRAVLPQVPKYLFKGKGYNISYDDLYMAQVSSARGVGQAWEGAAVAGDYHNGPLSVVIPFGIYGLIAFAWLLIAGARFLYTVYQQSVPELTRINAFLLALFLARVLFFLLFFGTLSGELYYFTGILGLSVALNVSGKNQMAETDPPLTDAAGT
jgi:O-Antigen ligase